METLAILLQIIHHLLNRNQFVVFWIKKKVIEGQGRVFKVVKIAVPLKYLSHF